MKTVAKSQILKDAGYAYSFQREIYVNRKTRKVFSIDFVEDHGELELESCINEPSPPNGEWRFYFNSPPSDAVVRELSNVLGQ